MEQNNIKPTPYSSTDTAEIEAIRIFEEKLDFVFVKPDIKKRDKTPNYDGSLEIVDEKQHPIGKIDVQVKNILVNEKKYSCDTELFAYAAATTLPFIFIGVDRKNKKVYWKQIKEEMLTGKENQQTITIYLEEEINESKVYLSRWKALIEEYQQRIKYYEELKEFEKCSKEKVPLNNLSDEDINSIQKFIDSINHFLDCEYKIIKKTLYKGVWKIGIAIASFNERRVQYKLFAIKSNYPEALIKYVTTFNIQLNKSSHTYDIIVSCAPNEIKKNPSEFAKKFIYDKLRKLIEKEAFCIRNEYLYSEYLFDLIDEHYRHLGIEKKDKYSIEELLYAFNVFLPYFVETTKTVVDLKQEKLEKIMQKVKDFIKKTASLSPFSGSDIMYTFRLAYEALNYFVDENVKEINRIYKTFNPRNVKREPNVCTYVWDGYASEDLNFNALTIINNLERVYNDFLKINDLDVSKYGLLNEYDKVIVILDTTPDNLSNRPPVGKIYYLKLEDGKKESKKIDYYNSTEFKANWSFDEKLINYKGNQYKLQSYSEKLAHDLFGKTPMLNLIYKILAEKVKKEFENK